MHIVHINLSRELRGGEWQTLALVEALAEMALATGIRQTLVVRKDGQLHSHCADLTGFAVYPVRPTLLRAARAGHSADIVHIHEGRSTKVGALLSLIGIPFVVTRRVPNRPKNFFLTRWAYSRAARVCCVSNDVARVMRDYADRASIATIYDCARPQSPARETGHRSDAKKLTLLAVGEVDFAHKGHDLLAGVARELADSQVDVEFLIAGTGRDEEELREMSSGLDNFHLLGWVDDIAGVLSRADVVVHPARKEGLGSVLLEAMALGKPVIAARVGGVPEIVTHEHNGLLVEPESVEALRSAVTRLATDASLRERLAHNASVTALKFSPQAMAEQYLSTYLDIAARRAKRARLR